MNKHLFLQNVGHKPVNAPQGRQHQRTAGVEGSQQCDPCAGGQRPHPAVYCQKAGHQAAESDENSYQRPVHPECTFGR